MAIRFYGKPEVDSKTETRKEVEEMEAEKMEYMNTLQAAVKWGITTQSVAWHCRNGTVEGAVHDGNRWAIPVNAEKPDDKRYKENQGKEV